MATPTTPSPKRKRWGEISQIQRDAADPSRATPARSGNSPANQGGTPRETAAHGLHQHEMAGLNAAVPGRLRQGERDRGGGGVGMPVDRHHHLLGRQM